MMRNNLRAVIGQVTRGGGRSVVSRRYFSSLTEEERMVMADLDRTHALAGGLVTGFLCFVLIESLKIVDLRDELIENYEAQAHAQEGDLKN